MEDVLCQAMAGSVVRRAVIGVTVSPAMRCRSSADDGHTDTLNSGCEQGFWAVRENEPVCLQIGRGQRLGDSSRVRGVLWLLGGVGEWGEVVEPRGLGEVERAQDLALAVGQLGAL